MLLLFLALVPMSLADGPRLVHGSLAASLGLLAHLPGRWHGHGLTLIALPTRLGVLPYVLRASRTEEFLEIAPFLLNVPNRGSVERDVALHAVSYMQTVWDARTGEELHREPGLFLRVPKTDSGAGRRYNDTYVRQGSVPHGNAFLAQSIATETRSGAPEIPSVDPRPPRTDYLAPFYSADVLATANGTADPALLDPARVLRDQLVGQNVTKTETTVFSSVPVGGVLNIPYLVTNARATRLDFTLWLETVQGAAGKYLQLQYAQRVMLDFAGRLWPHVSVATLVKA